MKINSSAKLLPALLLAGMTGAAVVLLVGQSPTEEPFDMNEFLATQPIEPSGPVVEETPPLGSVADMLEGLKLKLEADPGNTEGWLLLAKSYHFLKREAEAQEAFQNALASGYEGSWKPLPTIDSAMSQSDSIDSSALDIAPTEQRNTTGTGGTGSRINHPTVGIGLRVSLSAALEGVFPPETAVYVFARNAEGNAPPLAVAQKTVADLPLVITLDDHNAMVPGQTISTADRVVVGARISISGNALRQDGDLEKLSSPISTRNSESVELQIDAMD